MTALDAALAAIPPGGRIAIGFGLGAIIGSFLATLAIRWPKGESAASGRSRCDSCGRTLGWTELVPILGYLIRRGSCGSCGARIAPLHPATEVAAAAIGALSLAIEPGLGGIGGALFGWGLLLLALLDIEHFWLPDRVTLPLLALGLGFAAATGMPSLADSLIGAAVGFAVLFLIGLGYRALRGRDGLGGGDSKLLAAIGAWLGWAMLPFVLLLASLAGLTAALAARARGIAVDGKTRLPFGAFLAVAAWPLWLARDTIGLWLGAP